MKVRDFLTISAFLLIVAIFTGCGGDSGSIFGPTTELKPGEFQVSLASSIKGNLKSTSADFDLGTLKATQSYYFLLNNSGDMPITDVSLAAENASIEVYPQKIDQISNSTDVAAVPIISIKIRHGQTTGTVGHVPTLSPGDLSANVVITGKTKTADGEEISLSHSLNLSTLVQYADIKLTINGVERDLIKPNYSGSTIFGDGTSLRCYVGAVPVIENTGNTSLKLTIFDNENTWLIGPTQIREATLAPGHTYTDDFSNTTNNEVVIRIDTLGVVYDTERLKGHADGYIYFTLAKQ
ncbi:MAG TPA: hypothetical protein DCG57_03475 [Candidatus Riflebacteria bacterium]|jgi:hypothetical protein|nr:hypothetical protein [Candidatus Riflebacteria bacterium]